LRAYVAATDAVFGLVTAAHVWRLAVEPHVATDPWWILATIAAVGFCLWACRVLWMARGHGT